MLLLLGLITLLTWASAAPASAHDQLLSSSPADGAVLDTPPAAITLTFSAEILPISPTVLVRDSAGALVLDAEPSVAGAVVTQPMPPSAPADSYSVIWRVVSADGHPIEGRFAFAVASPTGPTPTATTAPAPEVTASAPGTSASTAPAPETTTTPPETSDRPSIPPLVRLLIAAAAVGAVATAAILVARRRAH
jgi:copper resistance protein C